MTNTDDIQAKLIFLRGTPFVFLCLDYIRPSFLTASILKNDLYPAMAMMLNILDEMGYKKLWTTYDGSDRSRKLHELFGFTILNKRIAFMQTCF